MRVSTSQINRQGINAILDKQAGLAKTQLQLSTGKRLVTPADDPPGAAQVLGLNQILDVTKQYNRNADAADARLKTEEVALVGVQDILQRVRELSIQANNGSQTNETRASIALEVRQRLDQLIELANSKDSNNRYLFAGYQEQTQPFNRAANGGFVYNGDDGQRFIQISDNRQVASSDPGSDVFLAIPNGNGTFAVQEDSANLGDGVIDPGGVVDVTAYDGDTYDIVFPVTTQTTFPISFNDVNADDALQYQLSINGQQVFSVDAASAPTTVDELATAINNGATANGVDVQAYVASGTLYLTNSTSGSNSITISESIANDLTPGDGDEIVGFFGSTLNGDSAPSADIVLDDANVDSYLVLDSRNNVASSGTYQEDARIEFSGVYTSLRGTIAFNDRFTVSPSVNQDVFSTIRDLADAMDNIPTGTPRNNAHLNNAINRGMTAIDQAMSNMENVRANVGARLSALEAQKNLNEDFKLVVTQTKSKIEDLDFVEAIGNLNIQTTALEASQQAYLRLQNLNLFNFLN